MARYTIDAPTLLHLVDADLECDPSHQLVAPNIIRSQALSVLFADVASGAMSEKAALEQHRRLTELKMRLLGDRVSRRTAWALAREHGWESTLDAEYIAVCKLQADAFVSVDPAMVAKAELVVPVAELSDLITT
jgi:predicted nucleic acid-binding protein